MLVFLPTELVIRILDHLDAQSVLTCKLVNKLLYDVVTNTLGLQYSIHLGLAGMQRNSSCSKPLLELLQDIKAYREARDTLTWNQVQLIDGWRYRIDIIGDVMYRTEGGFLHCFQLASERRGGKVSKHWTHAITTQVLVMDPVQDLLIFVEKNYESLDVFRIKVRNLSSNEPYPEVKDFTIQEPGAFNRYVVAFIYSDLLVASTPRYRINEAHVFILNWKTGELKLRIPSISGNFGLVGKRWIILSSLGENNRWTLDVYDSEKPEVDPSPICTFHLPEQAENTSLVFSPGSWNTLSSCRTAPTDTNTAFYPNQEDEILKIPFEATGNTTRRPLTLIIPTSTIRKHLPRSGDSQRPDVPWEGWGPDGVRLLEEDAHMNQTPAPMHWNLASASGLRLCVPIYQGEEDYTLTDLKFYDFNQDAIPPRSMARPVISRHDDGISNLHHCEGCANGHEIIALRNDQSPPGPQMQVVFEPTVIRKGDVFMEDVMTRLPYRVATMSLDRLNVDVVLKVKLADDVLVLLESNHPSRCTILSF